MSVRVARFGFDWGLMVLYRSEIDGLRAFAVLPVVFFHAGFPGFGGGYVGVDIFFVISGYLITSIILDEKQRNVFSFSNFYERRARRILPALTLVLIATSIAAFIQLPARYLQDYSLSLASVATFWSNIHFYQTGGYFSTLADQKPLLHTWSLAIEEQYYLIFPMLLFALWSLGRAVLVATIVLIALASFSTTQYLLDRQLDDMNFYLIYSRAWELMLGSLLAFTAVHKLQALDRFRDLLGSLGLLLIAFSVVYFDHTTPFPGTATLVPVLGTCMVIAFVSTQSRIGRLLSNPVLVSVGLVSYSLYLWHQPLFAFLRLNSLGVPPRFWFVVMIVVAFVLAYASWFFVEQPFRKRDRIPRRTVFFLSAVVLCGFFGAGMAGYASKGVPQRFSVSDYRDSMRFSPKRRECHQKGFADEDPSSACRYFGGDVNWAVMGDSHAVEIAYTLAQALEEQGSGLVHLSKSGCLPALTVELKKRLCTKWTRQAIEFLEKSPQIEQVVLVYRFSNYMHGDHLATYPELPNRDPGELMQPQYLSSLGGQDPREALWTSFKSMVERLLAAGKLVHVVYPVPELPIHIRRAVTPRTLFDSQPLMDLEQTLDADYYFRRHAFIIEKLNQLPFGEQLKALKPFDIFCKDGFCPALRNGKALYVDSHHVSLAGAGLLVDALISP